jgi:hypothetical protein
MWQLWAIFLLCPRFGSQDVKIDPQKKPVISAQTGWAELEL